MSIFEILALIGAGVLVGFINTLAGGGSIISLSLLMFMGLPATMANGTNRIAILLQTLTATRKFQTAGLLQNKKGLFLAIPTVIGSLVGSFIAIEIDEAIFEKIIVIIMAMMLFFIFRKPSTWLHGKPKLLKEKAQWWHYVLFFGIGIYGGFIHAGIGYLLLISLVLGIGFDLVKANAYKVLMVLLYIPFTLVVYIANDQVNYAYGFVMAIGNIAGAIVASKLAIDKGANFVRYVILFVVLLTAGHVFGLYNIHLLFEHIMK